MAKLTGVLMTDQTGSDVIYYGGAEYRKTEANPKAGDILRCTFEFSFLTEGAYYLAEEDEDGAVYTLGDNNEEDYEVDVDYTVFRRIESAPQSPQTPSEIRALIESKRAEISALQSVTAELEAQLAEMETINVGDYVRVVARTYNDEITVGNIARVKTKGGGVIAAYKLREIIGDITDWAGSNSIIKLTPAEAKAALLAQVKEAFESAE